MRPRRLPVVLLTLVAFAAAAFASGCGKTNDSTFAKEGAVLTLGDLEYNVVITRYLNPNDVEDKAYLEGAPPLPKEDYYLGVFMQVKNIGDTAQSLPLGLTVTDTEGNKVIPATLDNDFALPLGSQVEPGAQIPDPESAAANGPIQGSMVLFLIDQAATENRPLELQIPAADGETGEIELDL